jgi:hypothetical protein
LIEDFVACSPDQSKELSQMEMQKLAVKFMDMTTNLDKFNYMERYNSRHATRLDMSEE